MKRKFISVMLAAVVALASISSQTVVFASEMETEQEAQSQDNQETETAREEKDDLGAIMEGTEGLPEGQDILEGENVPEETEKISDYRTAEEAGIEAYAQNAAFEGAQEITIGQEYTGAISEPTEKQYYKFALESSGSVELTAAAGVQRVGFEIYDSQGKEVWAGTYSWNSTSQMCNVEEKLDLTKGEYYFTSEKIYSNTGNFTFKLSSFTSAEESHEETGDGTNNTMETASEIDLEKEYKGQLALNDSQDWYKFTLTESGRTHVWASANMERSATYKIIDMKGDEIWSETPSVNNAGVGSISKDIEYTLGFSINSRKSCIMTTEYCGIRKFIR